MSLRFSSVGGCCREQAGDIHLPSGGFLEASEAGSEPVQTQGLSSQSSGQLLAQGTLDPNCMGHFNCWDSHSLLTAMAGEEGRSRT